MTPAQLLKPVWLLGAGVSFPAVKLTTQQITDRVLSGEGITHHSSGSYYVNVPDLTDHMPDSVLRVVRFLCGLKAEAYKYFTPKPSVTYEHLYHLVSQIHDNESGDYENPAVSVFINETPLDIAPLLVGNGRGHSQTWDILNLAREASNYIRDVVCGLLINPIDTLEYLECFRQAATDPDIAKTDIFTLNHDTLLENYLDQRGVRYNNGFGPKINGLRYWNADLLDSEPCRVRILKLHGSVNWFRLRHPEGDWSAEVTAMVLGPASWPLRRQDGGRWDCPEGRPMILAGTFNKMLSYTSGVFADLHCQFHHSLRRAETLIVCGYSFGDKGINSRITEWIYSTSAKRLIVIHPEPDQLHNFARPAIREKWEGWKRQGRLTVIPKLIEEVDWPEIKAAIMNTGPR